MPIARAGHRHNARHHLFLAQLVGHREHRRLRDRLKTWYEGEGRNARIRIELPRGGYAALFHDPAAASAPKHEPAPAQRTMAVLPFANLNAGPENDYLCDGLTEELIHSLTKVRELRWCRGWMSWAIACHLENCGADA